MLKRQLKSLQLSLFLVLFIGFSVIGSIFLFHTVEQVPLEVLTRDITAIADLPIYTGILSQIGIFLWIATAAICLFVSQIISDRTHYNYMVASFSITFYLGLDDAFMFHESILPSIGIHQKIVILIYVIMILFFIWKFRRTILASDYLLMGLAFFSFGLSVIIDNLFWDQSALITNLIEDGAKFVGILTWLIYYTRTCIQFISIEKLETV